MVCIGCAARLAWPLCESCRHSLREGPQFLLDGTVLVSAGFHHHGVAPQLTHRLKYGGHRAAAEVLAAAMARRLPDAASVLVPVPRAMTRRARFGIDPAPWRRCRS